MYTGIIEAVGTLGRLERRGRGAFVTVLTPPEFKTSSRVHIGDSVAANGVCLTACAVHEDSFNADVSPETMELTCFKYYSQGQSLNLELPCTPQTHLGGHIVQGHVDGIGRIASVTRISEAVNVWVEAPADLQPYIANKGSIAVDGMSLTVNELKGAAFRLTIIPHTQQVTNFHSFKAGRLVNLEVDVLARYLERLLTCRRQETAKSSEAAGQSGLSLETLLAGGF